MVVDGMGVDVEGPTRAAVSTVSTVSTSNRPDDDPALPRPTPAMRWWALCQRVRHFLQAPARWWYEALLFFAAVSLYTRIQEAAPANATAAMHRGQLLWDAEGAWHLHPELWLNRQLVEHHVLGVVANYWYVLTHLGVTVSTLVWLFVAHRARYRRSRLVLLIGSLISLLLFWLAPTAPPRLLPHTGLVDTVVEFHTWGSYESGSLKNHADLLASMPSLHVGWAVWSGVAIALFARCRALRLFGWLYPVLTVLDVLATANHDLLDVLGGLAVMGAGAAIVWLTGRGGAGQLGPPGLPLARANTGRPAPSRRTTGAPGRRR